MIAIEADEHKQWLWREDVSATSSQVALKRLTHIAKILQNLELVFKDFLKERGVSTDILSLTEDEFDNRLQNLYSNIKSQKSDAYKKNTILCIRQSLNRYFRESGKKFDIITETQISQLQTSVLRHCNVKSELTERVLWSNICIWH